MLDLEDLKELGLSSGQVKVYSAILELGTGSLNAIHEKTGFERRAIYDILNKLIERGLISYTIESGKRTYQCANPKIIGEEIDKQKSALEVLRAKLPSISQAYSLSKPKIRAEVYRGNNAMRTLLEEALDYPATYWIGGNSGVETQTGPDMKRWFKKWTEKRVGYKRFMYDLVDFGTSLEDFPPNDVKKHKKYFYKYCQLPEQLCSPMVIIIFGNKVAQVLWSKQSFAFVLESEEIKESFLKYFHYFWKDPW
ncbi:MAG: helix-turn-helix domain-containing protein [Candidatus Micrarchaeota archaeon]